MQDLLKKIHGSLTLNTTWKVIFWTILFLAVCVRFWRMEFVPFQNDADEFAYTLAGQSLLEKGVPISWSSFSYPDEFEYETVTVGSAEYRTLEELTLIKPWFDHPFLLAVIQGATAQLFGVPFPEIPPSLYMRLPMLLASAITLVLLFLVGQAYFGTKAGLITLFLVGFSPVFILGQRMVVGENLYIPFFLAVLLAIQKKWPFVALVFLSLLAVLAKATGLVLAATVGAHFFLEKRYRSLMVFSFVFTILLAAVYGIYAGSIDLEAFITSMQFQSFRLLGWSNPVFILTVPGFHNYVLLDATYYATLFFGIFALIQMKQSKDQRFFFIVFCLLLVVNWASSAEQSMLGWYKLPLFTFLALLSGKALADHPRASIFSLGLVCIANLGLVRYVEHPLPSTELLRGVLILALASTALLVSFQKLSKFLLPSLASCLILCYVGYSFYFVHTFYTSVCMHRQCTVPLVTSTQIFRSWLNTTQ